MPKTADTPMLTALLAAALLTLAAPAGISHGHTSSSAGTGRAVAEGIGWDAPPTAAAAAVLVQISGIGWD